MALAAAGPVGCIAEPTISLDPDLLCRLVDSVGALQPAVPTLDDQFEALALVLPGGFGGSTFDAIVLVKPAAAEAVRMATEVGPGCPRGGRIKWGLAVRPNVVAGDFDFVQLRTWRRAIDDHLDPALRIVLTDVDEARNRVVVGVDRSSAVPVVRALADQLNVPSRALVVEVVSVPVPQ